MPRPFAAFYDLIYADKDYAADIAAFETLIGQPIEGLNILDIGAGAGGQSLLLARRARAVTAVEIDPDFADVLAAKMHAGPGNLSLVREGVDAVTGVFDAAGAFFHVLNYIGLAEMPGFLTDVARRLKPGAAFVADLWHAEAVLADPPRAEMREKSAGGYAIRQSITPHLDAAARAVRLDYEITLAKPGAPDVHFTEELQLRLWPRDKLEALMRVANFGEIAAFDYRAFPSPARASSWRIWLRARKA